MGQFGIRVQGTQGRNGLVVAVAHEDGVAFDVSVALGVGRQVDVEILFGIVFEN
jgi:hypothetical protein